MRIALTGVSGLIGSTIARTAARNHHRVTGLVRATSRRDHVEPFIDRFVVGDQADDSAWHDLLDGADVVIHNSVDWSPMRASPPDLEAHLRSNLLGSIRLLRASAPRPFIFMSSVAVHHDILPQWHGRIDETHPTRPGNLYGAYKAAVESHLWAAHFGEGRRTCAIRPAAVYGLDPNLPRSIGYPIIEQVQREGRYARKGGGKFVHVDDVAAVAIACAEADDVAGRTFSMADTYARWADWAHIAADLLGVEADIDFSSPAQPKNQFTKDAVQSLGVDMDRGFAGIREHLRTLIETMRR